MRFLARALTGLFLAAVTIGLLAAAGGLLQSALTERAEREPGQRPAREQVFAANVVTVTPSTITPVLSTFGEVMARRDLQIRATASGRVVEIGPGVEEGGTVTEGQLLFAIDPTDAETALSIAETDLQDARAEREDAIRAAALAQEDVAAAREQADLRDGALTRQRDLESRGVGTAAAVETAELAAAAARQQVLSRRQAAAAADARAAQARTGLSRAEIALAEARRALSDTRITADFDGAISDLAVTQGGLVSANEVMARLIDPDRLEIAFTVSTPDYVRLLNDEGRLAASTATVSLEVGGYTLTTPAEITREAPAVAEGASGRRLFARIEAPQGFRPGDFARVRVEEPPLERVTRLPAAAVDTADTVLVLGEDDRLEIAGVETLRAQGDDVIVRAEGLAGREVVAERSPLLGAGIKVRPLRQTDGDETAEATAPAMLDLTPERRAELIAMVEGNARMPDAAKERVLATLRTDGPVPARIVERIEGPRGG